MARQPREYKKLPGKSRRGLGYHSLWQAEDHILEVFRSWYSEEYKRYYFNDVQALITRKTAAGKVQNSILGLLAGAFLILTWAVSDTDLGVVLTDPLDFFTPATVTTLIFAGLFLLALLVNLLLGPTAETRIVTAVKTDRVWPLSRMRTAFKVQDLLRPVIEASQGRITPQEIARYENFEFSGGPAAVISGRYESGRFHKALYIMVLVQVLLAALSLAVGHVSLVILWLISGLGLAVAVIVALARQQGSQLAQGLQSLTWGALTYTFSLFVYGLVLYTVGVAEAKSRVDTPLDIFYVVAGLGPKEYPVIAGFTIGFIAVGAGLAIFGLVLTSRIAPPSDGK